MDFFAGQIVWFAFPFAPKSFALCNGQLLPINGNQALYSLLGTAFGGDGTTTFGLPNIQGRLAIGVNGGFAGTNANHPAYAMGAMGGEEFHTLSTGEMPGHNHNLNANSSTAGSTNVGAPGTAVVLGTSADADGNNVNSYANQGGNATLNANSVGFPGGGQGHENRMPYVVLNACICTAGIYPTRA